MRNLTFGTKSLFVAVDCSGWKYMILTLMEWDHQVHKESLLCMRSKLLQFVLSTMP